MADLTERLLSDDFEEALKELHDPKSPYAIPFFFQCSAQTLAVVIRELHARLRMAKAEGAAAREDVARLDRLEQWANETGVRIESFNSGHIRVHAGQFGLYASGIGESLREACDDAARSIPSSGGGK